MSDHNFEKQVQQKLDELKIPPADSVWSAVEAQIRKGRRRRRGVIFFLLFLLLTGAVSYFILENTLSSTNNSVAKPSSTESNPVYNNSTFENSKTVQDITKQNQQQAVSSKKTTGTKNKKISVENRIQQQTFADRMVGDHNPSEIKQNKPFDQKQQGEAIGSEDNQIEPAADSQANKIAVELVDSMLTGSPNNNNLKQEEPADTSLSDKLVKEKKPAEKKLKPSNWKWGVNASAGISNLVDGSFFNSVLGGEKALVADVSGSNFNSASGTGGPPVTVHRPSAIEKGFSFSTGAFIQKNLTKRFSVSTGIRYSYYSTHIRIGNQVDSGTGLQVQNAFGPLTVNQYYRSASVPAPHKYTNRFHFIELPVSFHARLNKSNRLPLFWSAGLSLSYLVSTNALHFDGRTGVYYKDNGLFNKLQANVSAGFSVSLWNASRVPVQIGPQLQYGFSNLMKREVSASKHLFYFGLNTKFFLKK